MRNTIIFFVLFLPFFLNAQTINTDQHSTYAVVVGISDYQDENIPDLRFAHKDAEALANFLRSPAGGSLNDDHLKVLINEKATMAQFAGALDWLWEVTKEGDQVILYFSGHGDVEKKGFTQPGFLLCWDAPPNIYMGGGALPLPMFQEVINTLSLQNKAKVLVITDACRSGKLAGSQINGNQLTNAHLKKKFAKEIKILSCQENEYSIEGEQWGGGRGAFSYHLIEGLFGMADQNEDLTVSLLEIGRYLEDHVSAEVNPQSQIPVIVGDRSKKLTTVNPEILAQIQEGKKGQLEMFSVTESRTIEDDVLAQMKTDADTSILELYYAFQQSLKDKVFISPEDACADVYYRQLIQEPKLEQLHSNMRRNYAAALQDDAQQVMNKWLEGDVVEVFLSKVSQADKYKLYPYYLELAAELLGSDHYMYPILKARQFYFEAYLMHIYDYNPNQELGEQILTKYRQSLKWQANSPQTYRSMARVYFFQMMETDSAEYYTELAMEFAPSWITPYSQLGFMYCGGNIPINLEKARHFLELADQVDSTRSQSDISQINNWGIYLWRSRQYEKAEKALTKALDIDSTLSVLNNTLGITYSSQNKHTKAEEQFNKAIQQDSTNGVPYSNLGRTYIHTGRFAEAEDLIQKAIDLDSTNLHFLNYLGVLYMFTDRFSEAENIFEKIMQLDPTVPGIYGNLGSVYRFTGRFKEAEVLLLKALQIDPTLATTHGGLGEIYYNNQQLDKAEASFKKAIQLDSTLLDIYVSLGNVYRSTNRLKEAEEHYLKVIQMDSVFLNFHKGSRTVLNAHRGLGTMYMMSRRMDKAEDSFKKTIQLDSTGIHHYQSLATVYLLTGKIDAMEDISKKMIQLDSTSYVGYLLLGQVYGKTQRLEEAEKLLKKVIQMGSPDPSVHGILGSIYQSSERWEEAEQQFLKVTQMDSTSFMGYVSLGAIYQKLNRWEESATMFEKTMKYGPPMLPPFVYGSIGNIYTHLPEKIDQAGPMLDKAIQMNPNNPQFYIYQAQLAIKKNQPEQAWQYLEQGLEKGIGKAQLKVEELQKEPDFEDMRKEAKWAELMNKYFPDEVKK